MKSKRRAVPMAITVPVGEKRSIADVDKESKKPSMEQMAKRAKVVQDAAHDTLMVDRIGNKDTRMSFTQLMSNSLQKQCEILLHSTKTEPKMYKSLQQRTASVVPQLLKLDIYELYRVPKSDEKVCHNATTGRDDCIASQLGPIGPFVATLRDKPLKNSCSEIGVCIACRIAAMQQAALGNMLCGQINEVRPCRLSLFEDALRVRVSPSGASNETEFSPNMVWNAPYTFNDQTKGGTHYGTIHHSPLLLNNLDVSPDKTRYIPRGFEFVDGSLHLKPDNNVPNITPGFL